MSKLVAKEIFLTKGMGVHQEKLASYEMALRHASIAPFNIVRVSSIFPPDCKLISKDIGLKKLIVGQVLFCVISSSATDKPNQLISSAVGVAIPKDSKQFGYLSEHHSFSQTEKTAGNYSEQIAAEMLATMLNIDFDRSQNWDEKQNLFVTSGKIAKTTNITQSALTDDRDRWTTVVAAAVLVL